MKNIKLKLKLLISFGVLILLTIMVGVTGAVGLYFMGNASSVMYEKQSKPLIDLALAIENMQRMRVAARNCVIFSTDPNKLLTTENDILAGISDFEESFNNFGKSIVTQKGRMLSDEINSAFPSFKENLTTTLNAARSGKTPDEIIAVMNEGADSANAIADNLDELMILRMDMISSANESNNSLMTTLTILISAVIILSVITAVLMENTISNLIVPPLMNINASLDYMVSSGSLEFPPEIMAVLKKTAIRSDELGISVRSFGKLLDKLRYISDEMEKIANGDLTSTYAVASDKDVIGKSLSGMSENLRAMFRDINSASMQIKNGSLHVSNSSQFLSQGATEQASAVEELSASIFEINGQVKANAEKAENASSLSTESAAEVKRGNAHMKEMLEAMNLINNSSGEIRKIIKVIEDIAFQTNILALNAAVEAARAGEAGKGFAVVADEVRNLASKSADAAKQTTDLIAGSIRSVENGMTIADETATSLVKIAETSTRVSSLIQGIAKASGEQSLGISQINQGVEQISGVVQTNSATAEENAAAAEEMSSQANILSDLVSRYKI